MFQFSTKSLGIYITALIIAMAFTKIANCQTNSYYRYIAQTLTSDSLYGRGYVNNGCNKAAEFIANEYQKQSLLKFKNNYFQDFPIPVNTINKTSLIINGDSLIEGQDYQVEPFSKGIRGKYSLKKLSYKDFENGLDLSKTELSKNEILFIDKRIPKDVIQKKEISQVIEQQIQRNLDALKCIIVNTNEKLTWGVSQEVANGTIITLLNKEIELDKVELEIQTLFHKDFRTSNIIGYIEGSTLKDSIILLGAHYDHLGMMGNAIYPGANDNASGVALLLQLAQYFSTSPPKYTIVFIAFAGEEVGLLGSGYFVQYPTFDLNKIKFMWNIDLAGTGDDGIQVVNSNVKTREIEMLFHLNDSLQLLPAIKRRGPACNSDHCFFAQKGIPAYFSYTLGGSKAYHDIYDTYNNLSFKEFEDYYTLIRTLIENY